MLLRLVVPTEVFKKWTSIFYGLWSVFTTVTNIYACLLEKKKRLLKTILQVIKDCQSYCTPKTQARKRRAVKR